MKKSLGRPLLGALLAGTLQAQSQTPDTYTVRVLDPPGPHRVYVSDPVFPHLTAGRTMVVDGDRREMDGQINAGFVFNLNLAPDHSEIYVTETYFSRGTRGDRTDLVTIYDPRRLEPIEEIILPKGRFLAVPKKHSVDTTIDGRYLLSFNMFPSTTVSVLDLRERRYLTEIEVPGCALLFPSGTRRFSMICADGSLLTVNFDPQGNASGTHRGAPFFPPETDPVFEHPAFAKSRQKVHFVSFEGKVYPVDLTGAEPSFHDEWSLLRAEDRSASWKPGGWQPFAIHQSTGRLYALMHQGPQWTQKQAGNEVWAYDSGGRRMDRLILNHPANSIAVSQDNNAQLYALSEEGSLQFYDLESLRYQGTLNELGDSPLVLTVGGE